MVEFLNEEGIDAGALKLDFLEEVIKQVSQELFESTGCEFFPWNGIPWGCKLRCLKLFIKY